MPFDPETLRQNLLLLIPLILSLSVHEWAHAWSAWKLGDDTAALMGRMTLNPLAHIDPIGTVLLPLLGVPFGWAKPVPVNPMRFTRRVSMRTGMMITAVAGPISNLGLVVICIIILSFAYRFHLLDGQRAAAIEWLLKTLISLNVILAVFNMLPIPPLDGSRVADALMPRQFRPAWDSFYRAGPLGLVLALVLVSQFHVLDAPVQLLTSALNQLLKGLVRIWP
jgi:Zn-dependent protease